MSKKIMFAPEVIPLVAIVTTAVVGCGSMMVYQTKYNPDVTVDKSHPMPFMRQDVDHNNKIMKFTKEEMMSRKYPGYNKE